MADSAPSSDSSSPDGNSTFDKDSAIDVQLKCMIESNLPFHAFESERFLQFFQDCLQPNYQRVSSTTLKHKSFYHYMKAKKDLIKYFKKVQSKVSLTIHTWKTSGSGSFSSPYLCIRCHWIDPETWKLYKRIISLEQNAFPYRPENVYDFVMRSISEFKLKDKIMSITLDDSVSVCFNAKIIEMLKRELNPICNGVFFQTKCICHILNLMVQSCLDFVVPVITKFQNLFYFAFRSLKANEYKNFVNAKGAKFSGIPASMPHEWDNIYKTLGLLVKQKSLLVEYYASCGEGESDIDDNDWETIESLLGILKVFHSSMMGLHVSDNPTSSKVLEELLLIANMFKEYRKNPFWEPVILEMQGKLLKYYESMPPVFTCAAALNPKIGIGVVENILEDIAGLFSLNTNYSDYADYARVSMTKCCDALHEVFDCYDKIHRSRAHEIIPFTCRNMIMQSVSRKRAKISISNELELYTKTDFQNVMVSDEFVNCNMLEWWKNKGRYQYPILGDMTRDLLTIQASTMALEFAFCLNGRVLDETSTYKISPRWLQMRGFLKGHFDEGGPNVDLIEDSSDESDHDVVLFYDSSDEEGNF